MFEKDMNILDRVLQSKNPKFLNLEKQKKKKRVARNHYMEKNQNVLLKLCHKMKNAKRCRLIKNVLKQNLKII